MKIVAKGNNSGINRVLAEQSDHHEYITAVDESATAGGTTTDDDDEGGDSITYIEDYEIAGNASDDADGDADGDAFFVEYVTEDDDNLAAINAASTTEAAGIVSGDSNDSEIDGQLAEYDDDDDGGSGGDEMAVELYNCSSCGMNFKSVTEHIQKHHPDQDVLIDISDENGATAIKTERTLDLNDDDDDDEIDLNDDNAGGDDEDLVGMVDGELIVYGSGGGGGNGGDDESLEGELIDDVLDETDDSVVYTYDDITGQVTRASTAKNVGKRTNVTKSISANKTAVSVKVLKLTNSFDSI